ncbi:MAG: hypothetical protein ACD_42C00018G0006 [uncultured bacterium]|nr:MAG: hypothetical protein ACD_42C00018G0006 [uncultured bacterium]OGT32413.1 MAG: hypothetical protein A3C44_04125 [Gammaproteobacteria bacterium RIFCSPHIGHO2_02_FULL_39_13]OGT48263.1 MAG: hypothetical protein A3E53_07870 [Gammaproteobacteria bacterium RIFCSPHIGHO2_12_FULL_39_24]
MPGSSEPADETALKHTILLVLHTIFFPGLITLKDTAGVLVSYAIFQSQDWSFSKELSENDCMEITAKSTAIFAFILSLGCLIHNTHQHDNAKQRFEKIGMYSNIQSGCNLVSSFLAPFLWKVRQNIVAATFVGTLACTGAIFFTAFIYLIITIAKLIAGCYEPAPLTPRRNSIFNSPPTVTTTAASLPNPLSLSPSH